MTIARFTSHQLRQLADQLEAYTKLKHAGSDHIPSGQVMSVAGVNLAYLYWWDDEDRYMVEYISFAPAGQPPLVYHTHPGHCAEDKLAEIAEFVRMWQNAAENRATGDLRMGDIAEVLRR